MKGDLVMPGVVHAQDAAFVDVLFLKLRDLLDSEQSERRAVDRDAARPAVTQSPPV